MVFSFKPFGDIASNENEEQSSFFDIIGVITSPGIVVRIKHDDTFLEQVSVDQTGVRVSREFDDLDVKSLDNVVCLETCLKKVRVLDDKKFRCDFYIKNFDVAVKRFGFIVNIVDDSSNASLLLWDREVVQLIGKRVTDLIGILNTDVKLADLLFGSDIVEVSGKGFIKKKMKKVNVMMRLQSATLRIFLVMTRFGK
ncbi:hypothetical protein SASPL_111785 [Salvia splendens]|uniref:Uncharacterized protein n=1 Tax=Salvia splendens TaxID=180675 RepID=A0A8X8YA37_SALSN|nr:hypothetical protein SASPL_111785 [Salvia splendens]